MSKRKVPEHESKVDVGAIDFRQAVREMLAFVEANRACLEGLSVKQLLHEGHRL
jgi:hypothetical protein